MTISSFVISSRDMPITFGVFGWYEDGITCEVALMERGLIRETDVVHST
jgi:hypothetical protein